MKKIAKHIFQAKWQFVLGAPTIKYLPPALHPEIAFIGRSNVGKSSLLNALTNSKIARISKTPGRTKELNFFMPCLEATKIKPFTIVDMPGYGYAKANEQIVKNWTKTIFAYLQARPTLKRTFVLIDARHGIKNNDEIILNLLDKNAVSYQIVLTKIDKIKQQDCKKMQQLCLNQTAKRPAAFSQVLASSAAKNIGLDELKYAICFATNLYRSKND